MTHRSTATATAPLSRLMASLVAGSLVLALAMLGATVAHADPGPSLTGSFMTTTPQKMLYASRFPGVGPYTGVLPTNAAVSEYLSTTPLVNLCLTDSAGKPVDATTPGLLAKVVPQLVRTTVVGARSTIDPTMLPLPVSDQAANPGCFRVPHAGSGTEDEGADVFSGYLNNDGIDGYRAGGGDVLLAPLKLRWGQLQLTLASSQATIATASTISLVTATPGGTPFVGRDLSAALPAKASAVFTPVQPTGTSYGDAKTVLCTTDAAGGCRISLTDPVAERVQVFAYDNASRIGATRYLGFWGMGQVSFRPGSVALASASGTTALLSASGLSRGADAAPADAADTEPATGPLRPGDVQHYDYTLLDGSGAPLAHITATLTLSNGFFTPDCTEYAACTFAPAVTDGALVGNLASLGKVLTLTSDRNGVVSFATAIGRDPGLDTDGTLAVSVSVVVPSGGSAGSTTASLVPFTTASITLANGGGVSLLPVADTDAISGSVPSNGTNLIRGQAELLAATGTNLLVRRTDQFGNLTSAQDCDVALAVTGMGYVNTAGQRAARACGSFAGDTSAEQFHLDADEPSSAAAASVLTATWTSPVTVFQSVPGSDPIGYTTGADAPGSRTNVAQVSVEFYAVDQQQLALKLRNAPADATVDINTDVTTTATVIDTQGNPAPGLTVTFVRTGAEAPEGTDPNGTGQTDALGSATYNFTSSTAGTATVTIKVLDRSGQPVTTGFRSVAFYDPTPTAAPEPEPGPDETPAPVQPTSPPVTPPTTVTINGGDRQAPAYNSRFVLTGTAPARAVVTLLFRKAGTPGRDYSVVRTATANSAGIWSRAIIANADYRYYATAGGISTASVLIQPVPTFTGPTERTLPRNARTSLTGTAVPGSLVFLHFRQGSAAAPPLVRSVVASAQGMWVRPFLATTNTWVAVSRTPTDRPSSGSLFLRVR